MTGAPASGNLQVTADAGKQSEQKQKHILLKGLLRHVKKLLDFTEIVLLPSQCAVCSLHSAAAVQTTLLGPISR